MFKKILSVVILSAIVFVGSQAQARDFYVGTSNTTGRDCYLMTETIKIYRRGPEYYDATLKMVRRSDGNVQYLDYTFYPNGEGGIIFENSQGYRGIVDSRVPIEWEMFWTIYYKKY